MDIPSITQNNKMATNFINKVDFSIFDRLIVKISL